MTFRTCRKPYLVVIAFGKSQNLKIPAAAKLTGLFTHVYYCNDFNCFALAYARVTYGLGNSFKGLAEGRTPTELKKMGETWYEDQREVSETHF